MILTMKFKVKKEKKWTCHIRLHMYELIFWYLFSEFYLPDNIRSRKSANTRKYIDGRDSNHGYRLSYANVPSK